MAWKQQYIIDRTTLRLLWELLGFDYKEWKDTIDDIYLEQEDACYYLPSFNIRDYRPPTPITNNLENEIRIFIETLCRFCGSMPQESDIKQQSEYEEAFFGILRTVTNLNLIPEDSTDYEKYFLRLDYILYTTMKELNGYNVEFVERIYKLIKERNVLNLLILLRKRPRSMV